jgi:hypothetical protein
MTKDEFLDECRFAKIVNASYDNAILVGGNVFFVTGPSVQGADDPDYAEWFVTALRRIGGDSVGLFAGSAAQQPGETETTVSD